jgi:hypothetical protein
MDERLEKALEFSNYMVTLNNQKRALKEKFYNECVFYDNGGTFTITKEMITFVKVLVDKGNKDAVLIDDNDLPIMIDNLEKFYEELVTSYFEASNAYYTEYQKLKTKRSVEALTK